MAFSETLLVGYGAAWRMGQKRFACMRSVRHDLLNQGISLAYNALSNLEPDGRQKTRFGTTRDDQVYQFP